MPRNWSRKQKSTSTPRNLHPLHPERRGQNVKKKKPKIKVYKTREYKIHHKKQKVVKKCILCKKTFTSQKELNVHTQDFHKYKFMCKHQKCSKIFSPESSLKKHELCHSDMKFKCTVCGRSFPFQSELNSHQAIHSDEKKFKYSYPRCQGEYKTKEEYNRNYKTHRPSSEEHQCPVCNTIFTKKKYLREHKQAHTGELPFKCDIRGD